MEKKISDYSRLPKEEPKNMTFEQIKAEFNKMENEKYKRPKKGEESKLTEYRKVTDKPVNKQEERQIVKNEILLRQIVKNEILLRLINLYTINYII